MESTKERCVICSGPMDEKFPFPAGDKAASDVKGMICKRCCIIRIAKFLDVDSEKLLEFFGMDDPSEELVKMDVGKYQPTRPG